MGELETGTFQRVEITLADVDLTDATEYEVAAVAAVLVASTKDEKVLWARQTAFVYDTAVFQNFEWALIKCFSTDATQDLSATDVYEKLLRKGQILKKGWIQTANPAYVTGKACAWNWKVYNVVLTEGEELRLVVRPMKVGANFCVRGVLEYRMAGG